MRRPVIAWAGLLLVILAAMAFKNHLSDPPPLRTINQPMEFDATRANARLALILGDERPHPADSAANDGVRNRIVALLSGMGLRPIVRDQFACNGLYKQRGVSCARVRNIIAVLGPTSGKAVLLNAHYDSTPVGPAAGDDGIGVATLLEVGSILKAQPLRRPIILLFNEGEELGLIGARAFMSDPLSRNVDSLVNLEARGVNGPVNMFETSRPNAAAVRVFSAAVERPVANSLSTDVYRLMPNYTDVNSMSERGWLTLNLAPIGNETRYHSAGDDLAALSPATLQHMGDQTLALTQRLAAGPATAGGGDRIFMDVSGRFLISLPLVAGVTLLAILILGFAWVGLKRGALGRGVAIAVGTIAASGLVCWVMLTVIGLFRSGMFWRAHPQWTTMATYASTMLVGAVLLGALARRVDARQLRPAVWLVFMVVGALIGLFAPGGIIFFLIPPLLLFIGMAARRWWWRTAETVAAIAAVVLLYFTWGAMLGLLEELLNSGPMWLFAPLGALLILPALVEAKSVIDGAGTRAATALAGTLALILWIGAVAAPAYSADRQQRFVIEHVTDANSGKAQWAVLNNGVPLPAGFTSAAQWRRAALPYSEARRWLAPAPPSGTKAPAIQKIADVVNGTERVVRLRLRTNGAERIAIIAPKDAAVRSGGTAGYVRTIDAAAADGQYSISCSGRACDGAVLDLVTTSAKPLALTLVGLRSGLPASASPLIRARPRFARPQYAPDETVAFRKVQL